MKHVLPNLESLKVFESAARQLSFSQAASELCLTRSAVSHQIKKLETETGVVLFKRRTRQVLLTDAGQQLYQPVQDCLYELTRTFEGLKTSGARDITIAVTTYVASRWLSPVVTGFCEQYPGAALQFQHTVNSPGFDIRQVDIAIRWGPCIGETDRNRLREMPMNLYPVANPALYQHIASVDDPGLSGAILLCEDRSQDLWNEWSKGHLRLEGNPRRVIADANVRVQAAIDGQGLILADDLMRPEISSGALVRIGQRELGGYGYSIMSPVSSRKRPEVKALLDWLV